MPNYDRWKDLPSQTLLDMGFDYWRVNKVDSALVCFTILSNRYNKNMSNANKHICCTAIISVANINMRFYSDYQTAYRLLTKAERIAEECDFGQELAYAYLEMGILLSDRLDLENNYTFQPEAIEQFKKVFRQSVKSKDFNILCSAFLNMSYIAMKFDHLDEISDEITTCSKLVIPDSILSKSFFEGLREGVMAYSVGESQAALDMFSHLVTRLPQSEPPYEIAVNKCMICVFRYVILLSLKRDASALEELNKAERIARENQLDGIVELFKMKQEYYLARGNTAMAKEYELKYYKAKDEFINRSKLLSVDQQKFLFELEEMGEVVKDLETQQRIRDLVIAGIGLLALLVIGILAYVWRNYKSTQQRNLLLFQKNQELLALEAQEKERKAQLAEAKKYKSSPMDDPAKDELLQRLCDIMESNAEIYDDGFTLDQLASLVGSNPNYVSQVINEKKGCNFNAFVNEYRIKEACRRLTDTEHYGGLTIEAIGQSLGFKSRTNFTAIFKRFTGMTPAAYQRMAKPHSERTEQQEENNSNN